MFEQTVSIAEGKKSLSRLIHQATSSRREIVLTRRGKPVAVLVPFQVYADSMKGEGYRKIMEARAAYAKADVKAAAVIEESRKQLARRP